MTTEMCPILDQILTSHRGATRDALMPILREIQEAESFLSREFSRAR